MGPFSVPTERERRRSLIVPELAARGEKRADEKKGTGSTVDSVFSHFPRISTELLTAVRDGACLR